jgi:hypothetical protein
VVEHPAEATVAGMLRRGFLVPRANTARSLVRVKFGVSDLEHTRPADREEPTTAAAVCGRVINGDQRGKQDERSDRSARGAPCDVPGVGASRRGEEEAAEARPRSWKA